MGREEERDQAQLWEKKYGPTVGSDLSTGERKLSYIENEIRDIKMAMSGSSSSKLWQLWKTKLYNLQWDRKYHLWSLYGSARYPRVEGQDTTTPPKNLKEQIPDL